MNRLDSFYSAILVNVATPLAYTSSSIEGRFIGSCPDLSGTLDRAFRCHGKLTVRPQVPDKSGQDPINRPSIGGQLNTVQLRRSNEGGMEMSHCGEDPAAPGFPAPFRATPGHEATIRLLSTVLGCSS